MNICFSALKGSTTAKEIEKIHFKREKHLTKGCKRCILLKLIQKSSEKTDMNH